MKLYKLSYLDTNWELSDLELDNLNLIVAKNSTGKSRTLMTIDLLVKMLTQKRNLNWGGRWNIEFETETGQNLVYEFATSQQHGVTYEKISLAGQARPLLSRSREGDAKIWNKLTRTTDIVYPPKDKLALHVNRDIKKYPFIEEITSWAEQSYGFKFGNINNTIKGVEQEYDFLTTIEDIPALYKSLNKENKLNIIHSMNSIGFSISEIKAEERGPFIVLMVKEEELSKPIPHYRLSQGMYRSIAIIIFIEYLFFRKKPSTIIIDDLCEGLDYERASKLGKLLFDKCEEADIQLIVTSNDSFLMDIVDIKYWNILKRAGKKVTALNDRNSHDLFVKFKFTGLSNFDFFSSDFIFQQK